MDKRPPDPLARAARITRDASALGFDWPDLAPVIDKVREELAELEQAVREGDPAARRAELGDLLFAVVNVARFLDVAPGEALDGTTARFEARFAHVVRRLAESGRRPEEASLAEMDALWEEAKALGH